MKKQKTTFRIAAALVLIYSASDALAHHTGKNEVLYCTEDSELVSSKKGTIYDFEYRDDCKTASVQIKKGYFCDDEDQLRTAKKAVIHRFDYGSHCQRAIVEVKGGYYCDSKKSLRAIDSNKIIENFVYRSNCLEVREEFVRAYRRHRPRHDHDNPYPYLPFGKREY